VADKTRWSLLRAFYKIYDVTLTGFSEEKKKVRIKYTFSVWNRYCHTFVSENPSMNKGRVDRRRYRRATTNLNETIENRKKFLVRIILARSKCQLQTFLVPRAHVCFSKEQFLRSSFCSIFVDKVVYRQNGTNR